MLAQDASAGARAGRGWRAGAGGGGARLRAYQRRQRGDDFHGPAAGARHSRLRCRRATSSCRHAFAAPTHRSRSIRICDRASLSWRRISGRTRRCCPTTVARLVSAGGGGAWPPRSAELIDRPEERETLARAAAQLAADRYSRAAYCAARRKPTKGWRIGERAGDGRHRLYGRPPRNHAARPRISRCGRWCARRASHASREPPPRAPVSSRCAATWWIAAAVARAVAGVEVVYHIAATYREAGQPDSAYTAVNVDGTRTCSRRRRAPVRAASCIAAPAASMVTSSSRRRPRKRRCRPAMSIRRRSWLARRWRASSAGAKGSRSWSRGRSASTDRATRDS